MMGRFSKETTTKPLILVHWCNMRFNIAVEIDVDEGSNVLSTYAKSHEQDVADAVANLLHDLDDAEVSDIVVTKLKD